MNKILLATAIAAAIATPAGAFDNREALRAWNRQTEENERMLSETQSQLNRMQERAYDDMREEHNRFFNRNRY